MVRSPHYWHIGHFQTVGHVAGEGDIKDGSFDAVILHNIDDTGHEGACLPGKGTAGFKNHAQMGEAAMEILQGADKQFHIVVLSGHEVSAAEVDPFELREPRRELIYNMYERARESLGSTLTMAMDVEALQCGR